MNIPNRASRHHFIRWSCWDGVSLAPANCEAFVMAKVPELTPAGTRYESSGTIHSSSLFTIESPARSQDYSARLRSTPLVVT